jgi:hypothetical protein
MSDDDGRALQILLDEKANAERAGDVDAVLRVFIPEPVIEFFPIGRRLKGRDQVGRFYSQMMSRFLPLVVGVEPGISISDGDQFAKEQQLTLRSEGDDVTYRMVVFSGVRDGRLWGQRYYSSDGFIRLLVGDLLDSAERLPS